MLTSGERFFTRMSSKQPTLEGEHSAIFFAHSGCQEALQAFDKPKEACMSSQETMETVKLRGNQLIDQLKQLVHEGNVRRIVIKHENEIVAEFPLTIGVVGVVFAPILAAVGALVAILADCTIELERVVASPPERYVPTEAERVEDVVINP